MSYIGKTPTPVPLTSSDITDSIISLPKLTDGTDGNIISYDASGNPVAVATGTDGQVLTSAGAGAQPAFETLPVGGITMADQWRLSAHKYGPDLGGTSDITANLERIDTDSPGYIGSAMTQSSGIFTFPVTGTYLVSYVARYVPAGATNRVGINIQVTTDNSSYSNATFAHGSADASGREVNVTSQHLLNVNNTTNVKVKFTLDITGGTHRLEGNSTETRTGFTFIRLGDST